MAESCGGNEGPHKEVEKKKYIKPMIESLDVDLDVPFMVASCAPLVNCAPDCCTPVGCCGPGWCYPVVCAP